MATVANENRSPRGQQRRRHPLVRHYLEMVLAMVVGMVVLGMAV